MTEPHLSEALRDLVREPVVPPALAARVKHAHARRRRRLAVAGGVAAVAVVAGAATLVPADRRADPVAPAVQVIGGSGTVVAAPGQPVRFCRPTPQTVLPNQQPPRPPECPSYVTVSGTDLDSLSGREELDGTVWGGAWLAGTYADGTLAVTRQEAPRREPRETPTFGIPCPAPAGGWTAYTKDREPLPVNAWSDAHPGMVVGKRVGYTGRVPVLIVVATDVEAVEAGLRPEYGNSLCIVASRYTQEQIDAAIRDVAHFLARPGITRANIDDETQMYVEVPVAVADEEAEALVARHPEGLIRLNPWLRPLSP